MNNTINVNGIVKHELHFNHWYIGLPQFLKQCLPNWNGLNIEQKYYHYSNPSNEFAKLDMEFRTEMERYNNA